MGLDHKEDNQDKRAYRVYRKVCGGYLVVPLQYFHHCLCAVYSLEMQHKTHSVKGS